MARLVNPKRLIEKPRNTPLYVEYKGEPEIRFMVAWVYYKDIHAVRMLSQRVVHDIDEWNVKWRAWTEPPTKAEREAQSWWTKDPVMYR